MTVDPHSAWFPLDRHDPRVQAFIAALAEYAEAGLEAAEEWANDAPTVCIAHGRFIPCRKNGQHRYTDNPYWVKSVRDYQTSTIVGLTWEPA